MSLERQDEKFCRPCWRNKGLKVLAHRLTSTGPKCDACWRGNVEVIEQAAPFSLPPIELEPRKKEQPMPGKFSGIDKAAMQRDRESGMAVLSIAKKYACPPWFVYQNTKTRANGANGASKPRATRGPLPKSSGQIR